MKKGCWIGLGTAGAVVAVSVFALARFALQYWDFGAAAGELPAAVREYKAAGLPFVAADLAPAPFPAAQNAAPSIRAALKALPKKVKADLSKAEGAEADAAVALYAKPLALLDPSRKRVDFKREWDLGPNVLFPEYAGMKTLAKAATLRAVRSAQRGDDASAVRDLELSRQLSLWAAQEPTMIGMLVGIAIEAIALDGAESCLAAVADSPARIARYARWLDAKNPLPDFGHALRGEAWMGVMVSRNLDKFGGVKALALSGDSGSDVPPLDLATLRRDGVPEDGKLKGFLARQLQLWAEAYRDTDGFRQPPEKIGQKLDAIASRTEGAKGLSYYLASILFPVFSQAGSAVVTLEARREVGRAFAKALTDHALTHRWPTTVAGIDPFTGKPLRIRPDGKGIRIYSVGRDRKDDKGLLRRETKGPGPKSDDVAAAYPPIPR